MPDGRLDVEIACDERAPATARSRVDAMLVGLPADARFAGRLMASELVANVLRHAGLGPDDRLRLTCAVAGGVVRCEVHDHGVGYDPARPVRQDELSAGLGLDIVRSLATSSGVETVDGETIAWFELALPASADGPPTRRAPAAELGSHSSGDDR